MLFTANDSIGPSGQFLELKRLSDALARLQQRLTEKNSPVEIKKVKDLVPDSCPVNTTLLSCQGRDEGGKRRKRRTCVSKNSNSDFYEAMRDEGVEDSDRDTGDEEEKEKDGDREDRGKEEEEEEEEGEEEGEGEGEGEVDYENPRLSKAHREYPGFTLTGPDIYTSADDHCLQVRSYVMLCYDMLCYVMSSYLIISHLIISYFSIDFR